MRLHLYCKSIRTRVLKLYIFHIYISQKPTFYKNNMFQRHSTVWWILKRAAARLIKTYTNYLRFIDIIPSFKTISTLCFKYQI